MAILRKLFQLCCLIVVIWAHDSYGFVNQISNFGEIIRSERSVESAVSNSFVLLGASGDLAKRKIYPSLWNLYRNNLLPPNTRFYGYALSEMTVEQLRVNCAPFIKVTPNEEKLYDKFWQLNAYINGTKNADADYDKINEIIEKSEKNGKGNRIFYLALPPVVFPIAGAQIKRACMAKNGDTRVVIEKPFGHDSASSEELSNKLKALFTEDQIYRMDHYLGKEMVQNILTLRFDNRIFEPTWNKDNIAAVEILFEESIGVEGRGNYFDSYGIIRDVMQNHLLQIMSLIAMDKPDSGHHDDVRDAKVELLKKTKPIILDDVVLGQYVGNPDSKNPKEKIGYVDDPTVPKDSITPTFALTVLKVDNERWRNVPFIIRAGKGLKEKKTEVRIQYRDVDDNTKKGQTRRNEIVFTVSRNEAVEINIMSKSPSMTSDIQNIGLDFVYKNHYNNVKLPEAYERLLLDVFRGSQNNFVRTDELREAWRIFTPILHEIQDKKIRPINYKFGTRGPVQANDMERKNNFL